MISVKYWDKDAFFMNRILAYGASDGTVPKRLLDEVESRDIDWQYMHDGMKKSTARRYTKLLVLHGLFGIPIQSK
jgi:hypothetical protein